MQFKRIMSRGMYYCRYIPTLATHTHRYQDTNPIPIPLRSGKFFEEIHKNRQECEKRAGSYLNEVMVALSFVRPCRTML